MPKASHLECSLCGARYDAHAAANLCACGGPLLVRFDLNILRHRWLRRWGRGRRRWRQPPERSRLTHRPRRSPGPAARAAGARAAGAARRGAAQDRGTSDDVFHRLLLSPLRVREGAVIATNVELTTSAPLARGLPALYREPDPRTGDAGSFVRRFTDGLDGVLAPVFAALDNLPAYFDPKTAPEHFLDWLAAWVGLELFEKWSPDLRRSAFSSLASPARRSGSSCPRPAHRLSRTLRGRWTRNSGCSPAPPARKRSTAPANG